MIHRLSILGALLLSSALLAGCAATRGGNPDMQLIRAAEKGHTQEMYRLIKAGADINAVDPEGWTPYLAASSMGHFEAMRMLKAFGARTDAPETEPGATAHRLPLGH
jgi:ankyrin repeat protein